MIHLSAWIGYIWDRNKIFFFGISAWKIMSRERDGGRTSGMERIARIPRLQSDLWETNASYKITLPIQIGKLMVAFVDSLFGPRDNGGLLNYYPEIVQNFRNANFRKFSPVQQIIFRSWRGMRWKIMDFIFLGYNWCRHMYTFARAYRVRAAKIDRLA